MRQPPLQLQPGTRVGTLTLVDIVSVTPAIWKVACDCGASSIMSAWTIQQRRTKPRTPCDCYARHGQVERKRAKPKASPGPGGYRTIRVTDFPGYEGTLRQVLEHRYVMAKHLGRPLLPTERVKRRDGNRANNRIENLELHNTKYSKIGTLVTRLVQWAKDTLALRDEIPESHTNLIPMAEEICNLYVQVPSPPAS